MFPIRDDNPQVLRPVVTLALVAANAASWLLVQGLGSEPALVRSVCELGLIPAEVLDLPPEAAGPCDAAGGGAGWATAVTSMFLHGGWMHLIGNMWFLWIFGNNVEDAMGSVRFVIFYLLCGVAAAALQVSANVESMVPMVGASGAIEAVTTALTLFRGMVHRCVNLEHPDPECDLNLPRTNQSARPSAAMSNSFAFGGHNASLIFESP